MKCRLIISLLFTVSTTIFAQSLAFEKSNSKTNQLSNAEIKSVVHKAMETFYVPGMSVGIIHQGKIVHLKGYGIKDMQSKANVNGDTLFRLASTSKAFTAASLAILVDEGKIHWQDKVIDYLPNFRMMDHWVTGEFTIEDLLTHKSGLVSSAGDSMLWPEPSGFSRDEIIGNLRYLTPQHSFRSKYAYSNLMYITAGEIVAKVSGQSWESFVGERIFTPLNMNCFAGDIPNKSLDNIATPHGERNGKLFTIPRNGINGTTTVSAAAGGIVCNASGMLNWLQAFLDNGTNSKGEMIFSEEQLDNMWKSRTILSMSKEESARNNSHFRTYGFAWRKNDFLGYELISHTGTLSGMQAYVALIPELKLGVVLLNNGDNSGARSSVMQSLLRGFIPNAKQIDWVADYKRERAERSAKYLAKHKTPKGSGTVLLEQNKYTGSFEDHWFGSITIKNIKNVLRISSEKMVTLQGTLEPFNDHTFVIRWDNKNAASDAFIHFKINVAGEVESFELRPFKIKASINHEYRDMLFTPVQPKEP